MTYTWYILPVVPVWYEVPVVNSTGPQYCNALGTILEFLSRYRFGVPLTIKSWGPALLVG